MKNVLKFFTLLVFVGNLLSCAGQPLDDNSAKESEEVAKNASDSGLIDESGANSTESSSDTESSQANKKNEELDSLDQDLAKEQKSAGDGDPLLEEDPLISEAKKDQSSDSPQEDHLVTQEPQPIVAEKQAESAPTQAEESNEPLLDEPLKDAVPSVTSSPPSQDPQTFSDASTGVMKNEINNIRFQGNEGGGSILIESNQSLEFTGHFNPQTKQYVVEIRNAHLPEQLKRPFITKDFQTLVGSIDAYQAPGSDTVKVVVQMREGAGEPTAHSEDGSIIITPSGVQSSDTSSVASQDSEVNDVFSDDGKKGGSILSSTNLEQFLSGNLKYSGKKISIEVKDIEVRNAINLIAEESGANLVMSEAVSGNIALKLRNVPWDQALVLILKAKKLGYTRQGNVLRISPISEIKQEEEDAIKLAESRKTVEPLKVQLIPINYAKITDLKDQIEKVLSGRGKIVADVRSNSLIITETEEVLDRAKKIISSLDIAPAQVLIEGKIVEARDVFTKKIGVNWYLNGQSLPAMGNANLTPNLNIRPGVVSSGSSSLGFGLTLGTIDMLGDLNAVLALEEQEENVKVISSPRIVTLHNVEATITQTSTIAVLASEATDLATKVTNRNYRDLTMKMELKVTPEVANNGIVQMQVDIVREFPGAPRDNGGANSNARSAKTKVMVKSGQTAVIGGIFQNDATEIETGVPFLKDIPFLGALFRGKNYTKNKTELLLFLTPRVLSQAGGGPSNGEAGKNLFSKDDNQNHGVE